MSTTSAAAHLSDADLVRHLDREGDADERDRREAHLRDCPPCADRVRRLGEQSGLVGAWLARADHPHRPRSAPAPRHRTGMTPWLRAAAIVLLLAAPLAAVPPVRQWVADRIGLAVDDEPAAATLATAPDPAHVIRFTPAPGTFTVRVDAPAPGATLALGRSEGAEAVLEAAPAEESAAGAAPVVSDDALRLPATPGRRWALRLPDAVDDVVVVIGGSAVRVPPAALEAGRTVDLAVNR